MFFPVSDKGLEALGQNFGRDASAGVGGAMRTDVALGRPAATPSVGWLTELRTDRVDSRRAGRVVKGGGPELAEELERTGYEGIAAELGVDELTVDAPEKADPFAEPGF